MANTRMTLVIRKDLQLVEGLAMSQAVHCAMEFIRKIALVDYDEDFEDLAVTLSKEQADWLVTPYLSILAVQCAEDLDRIIEHAEAEELPFERWVDTIPSPTFPEQAIKVVVGCSIGPADFDKISIVCGSLKRY